MNEKNMLQDLRLLVNKELQNDYYNNVWPGLVFRIVLSTNFYFTYSAFLLAKTLLRYSDIISFSVSESIDRGCFFISQKKTGLPIRQPFLIFDNDLKHFLKLNDDKLIINKYDSLRREIQRVIRNTVINYPLDFNNKTHIFRHLIASHLRQQGYDLEYIKKNLGHYNLTSTRYYIHDFDLKENILSQK